MPETPDKLGITAAQWAVVHKILRRHVPDHTVWGFGSRVRGSPKRYPDLDLAVIADTPVPWQILARLSEDFVESDLPRRVGIVDWAELPATFRDRVAQEHVVIHEPSP